MKEKDDAPHTDMRIQAHMEQINAESRDLGSAVQVSTCDLFILGTLAEIGYWRLAGDDATLSPSNKAKAMAMLRDQLNAAKGEMINATETSLARVLLVGGSALLTEERIGKFCRFHVAFDPNEVGGVFNKRGGRPE